MPHRSPNYHCVCSFHCPHLSLKLAPQRIVKSTELLAVMHMEHVPGTLQWHFVHTNDSSRPGTEQHDTIAQADRLVQIVGDEYDRDPRAGPKLQHQVLQHNTCLRIQRPK